ncbi:MAG: VOC family protein [Candidatus Anammoxibacter sp.]
MKTKGTFHHVHLLSENPQETSRWYVEKLGGLIENEAVVRGSVLFRIRIGEALLNIRGLWPEEKLATPVEGKLAGIDHFALAVDDIEAWMRQLKGNSVKITEPIFTTSTGTSAFFIEGPDGVLIEIIEG